MKNFFILLFVVLLANSQMFSQAGSVELRDGGGVLVGTYASITEAYNAVPAPLVNSYVIEILIAYTGASEIIPIILGTKAGTDSVKTITIRPAAGNFGELLTASLNNNSTVIFDACEYVIIDGRPGGTGEVSDFTIENTYTSGTSTYAIHFRNGASHNTVKYVYAKGYTMDTAGPRVIYFGVSPSNVNGNSYNIIELSSIIGGRSGIGTSGTTGSPNTGNIIRYCTIENFGYAGIWLLGNTSSTIIEGNVIQQKFGYNTSIVNGILTAASGALGHTKIIGNLIQDIQMTATSTSASVKGIVLSVSAGAEISVINNFVSLTQNNLNAGSVFGIQIQGTTNFTSNIHYNSVFIGGVHNSGTTGAVTSAGFVKTLTGTGAVVNMKNNIFVNKRTGGNAGAYHVGGSITSTAGTLDLDYNLYYAAGASNSYCAAWSGAVYNDFAQYKAAASPNEGNSLFKNVHFISSTDLHLADSSVGDYDLAATPIEGITTDFDGQLRSLTTPYKGGDEADVPIPVELTSLAAFINGNSVTLKWTTATETNNFGFEIERYSKNSDWQKAGFVKGNNTTTLKNEYSFTDAGLQNGKYSYRIKQVDFDGSFKYYNIAEEIIITQPVEFELSQNYPNPFNPATVIKYSIPEAAKVSLILYNALGSEVAVLLNDMKEAGAYTYEFSVNNIRNLSSGVYFYTLRTEKFVKTKKMVILK